MLEADPLCLGCIIFIIIIILGVSDLVDLYRMAVENIEIMDDHFASRSFESTMVGQGHSQCWNRCVFAGPILQEELHQLQSF